MLTPVGKSVPKSRVVKPLSMILAGSLLLFLFTGCATMQKREAARTERMLSASGFQMRFADTPEKIAQMESFKPRTLTPQKRDGKLYYIYADNWCGCLYVGTEKAYQRYQLLADRMHVARENLESARIYHDAQIDWDMWGPWGPWW